MGNDHCRKRYGTKRTASQGIKYAAQGMDVSIEFYSPTIVRVYKTLSETASDKESLVVTKTPEQTSVSFGEKGKNVTLSSNAIQVEVNPATGDDNDC